MLTMRRPRACVVRPADPDLVAQLHGLGALPAVPWHVTQLSSRANPDPSQAFNAARALRYYVAWNDLTKRPTGVCAVHDHFDHHTLRQISEIVSIAGSRRAVVELLRQVRRDAEMLGRVTCGQLDLANDEMIALVDRLARRTRMFWEA